MNRALLNELRELRADPSITVLHTTSPGPRMSAPERDGLEELIGEADRRLGDRVGDDLRRALVGSLRSLLRTAVDGRATRAVAICVSPEHEALVRLGREVKPRVVIDDTFATHDMVADTQRTATFRVVTVGDRTCRLLLGDADRIVEVCDDTWPLRRAVDDDPTTWLRLTSGALRREQRSFVVPTVFAGAADTVEELTDLELTSVGTLDGHHDRTPAAALHRAATRVVTEWLDDEGGRALSRLERARGERLFAGAIDEMWDLARTGRVELLVVEDGYRLTARTAGGHVAPTTATCPRDASADALGELIETVARNGGETVTVPPGELRDQDQLAAILRP